MTANLSTRFRRLLFGAGLLLGAALAIAGAAQASTPLDALGRDGGARFGDWVAWRFNGPDQNIVFVNTRTRNVYVMPWTSNGWLDFRNTRGEWFVAYSSGAPERKVGGKDFPADDFLARRTPSRELATGDSRFLKWTAKVTPDEIQLNGADFGDRIILRRNGALTHNGRELGETVAAPAKEFPPPKKEAGGPARRPGDLAKGEGVRYGEWVLWRATTGEDDAFWVHTKTNKVFYMPWTSNGWLNFRDTKGTWYVMYSMGPPELQNRDDLKVGDYTDRPQPTVEMARGTFKLKQWTVTVNDTQIEMVGDDFKDRLVIPRLGSVATHNGRKMGD